MDASPTATASPTPASCPTPATCPTQPFNVETPSTPPARSPPIDRTSPPMNTQDPPITFIFRSSNRGTPSPAVQGEDEETGSNHSDSRTPQGPNAIEEKRMV